MVFAVLKTAICSLLITILSGVPAAVSTAHAADAGATMPRATTADDQQTPAMSRVTEYWIKTKEKIVPAFAELETAWNLARSKERGEGNVRFAADKAMDALKMFKAGLEDLSNSVIGDPVASDALYTLVIGYYDLKGLLAAAYEAMDSSSGTSDAGVYTARRMADLDLVFPCPVVVGALSKVAAESPPRELGYDLSLQSEIVSEKGRCLKRLSLSGGEAARFRMKGFLAFPDRNTLERPLVFEALKLNFQRQAMLNQHLYGDEKEFSQLPSDVDPAIRLQQTHALSLARETLFRKNLFNAPAGSPVKSPIQQIADDVPKRRIGFERKLFAYFNSMIPRFVRVLSVSKIKETYSLSDSDTAEIEAAVRSQRASLMSEFLARRPRFLEPVVGVFSKIEPQLRHDTLAEALQKSTAYLSQMTRDELRSQLAEAERASLLGIIVAKILNEYFIDLDAIGDQDFAEMLADVREFVEEAFPDSAVPDSWADLFQFKPSESDSFTSFARYELAGQLLDAVEKLEQTTIKAKIIKKMNETRIDQLDRVNRDQAYGRMSGVRPDAESKLRFVLPARLNLVPSAPDVGVALQSIQYTGKKPQWADEILLYFGSRATRIEDAPTMSLLKMAATRLPKDIGIAAHAALAGAQFAGTIDGIRSLHQQMMKDRAYRWQTMEGRLATLLGKVEGDVARRTIRAFLRLSELTGELSSLREKVNAMLEELVGGEFKFRPMTELRFGKYRELESLLVQAREADAFFKANKITLAFVFGPAPERTRFLVQKLTDRKTLLLYYENEIQNILAQYPFLRAEVQLASKIRESSRAFDPVKLADLVSRIKSGIKRTNLQVPVVAHLLPELKARACADPGALNDELFVSRNHPEMKPIDLEALIEGSMLSYSTDWKVSDLVVGFFLDSVDQADVERGKLPSGAGFTKLWYNVVAIAKGVWNHDAAKRFAPTADNHWPKVLKIRDLVPALNDSADPVTITRKVVLSSLLSPYLRSAAIATRDEVKLLLNPSVDTRTILLESKAFQLVSSEGGALIGGELAQIQKDTFKFRRFWNGVKETLAPVHEMIGTLFYGQIFGSFTSLENELFGFGMFGAAVPDLTADMFLWFDSWQTYWSMRPFAYGGGFGMGLFYPSDLENKRQFLYQQSVGLYDRVPMDLVFFWSMTRAIGSFRLRSIQVRREAEVLKMVKIPVHEYTEDRAKLQEAIAEIGANPQFAMMPEEFNRAYGEKLKELKARSANDASAIGERKNWVSVKKLMNRFYDRYGGKLHAAALLTQAMPVAQTLWARDMLEKGMLKKADGKTPDEKSSNEKPDNGDSDDAN